MWAVICGFSDTRGEETDDCSVVFFDEEDKKKAEAAFDELVAEGEYHFVRLSRVIMEAAKTFELTEFPDV